jgi:SpoVK/Ycf46/Vps4 family AAA+-type ATPase
MIKDTYLESCKKKYIIKAGELLGKAWTDTYLEFAHGQFESQDIDKIISTLDKSLKEYLNLKANDEQDDRSQTKEEDRLEIARHSSLIQSNRSRRRSYRRYSKIEFENLDQEEISQNLTVLSNSKYYPVKWASSLESLFEMIPDLFLVYKEVQNVILEKSLKKKLEQSDFKKYLENLKQVFKLNEKEGDIITFLFLVKADDRIDDFFGSRNIDILSLAKSTKYFCRFFEVNPEEMRRMLSKDSTLIKAGIIQKPRREDLELSDNVLSFLGGYSNDTLESKYVNKIDLTDALRILDHNISNEKSNIFKNLLDIDKGCNILLYGHPGTGKTEFAKSLALETGKTIYFVRQSDTGGDENLDFRKQAIIAAQNIIDPTNSIIVIDECDTIVNIYDGMWKCESEKSQDRKAWINSLLETSIHKIIWISNKVGGVDDSTKRRFSYSMEFQPLSYLQRKKVWEVQVNRQQIDFLGQSDIEFLAREIKVNSGGITLALQDVAEMGKLITKESKFEMLISLLKQHKAFTEDVNIGLVKKSSKYSLDIVNANYPLDKILETSDEFFHHRDKFERAGIYNMNILLQGPPGTGKTEFVKHLAEVTDKELIIKRVSDIKSKWYGESVKNIAASFKEAQKNNSILFFDEADSFFASRENSRDMQAEETNEFLTQMENFHGLLICATNFTDRLDQASMRRFNHKVKFDYLTASGKKNLFRTYFLELFSSDPNDETWNRLDKISGLTPGDYKVVYQKNVFLKQDPIYLVNELENEVSYKKAFTKKVGLS